MSENKIFGIDISEFNGDIDFSKVKEKVDFVMIRATFGRFGIDKKFIKNTNECIKFNIPFGFYFYSYATDIEKVKEEVTFFLQQTKLYHQKASFPYCIDMEDSDSYKLNHRKSEQRTFNRYDCHSLRNDKRSKTNSNHLC